MKTAKSLILACLVTASSVIPIYGADRTYKAALIGAALMQFYIGAVPMLQKGLDGHQAYQYIYDPLSWENAHPLATTFIQDIIQREGVCDHDTFKVYVETSLRPTNMGVITLKNFRCFFIPKDFEEKLQASLETDQSSEQAFSYNYGQKIETFSKNDFLTLARAKISHEIGHIKNNDTKTKYYSQIYIPLITFACIRLKPLNKVFHRSGILLASSAFFLQYINSCILAKNQRMSEFKADDAITRPDEMLAFKRWLQQEHYSHTEDPCSIKHYFESLLDTHPLPMERIARLESRLQEHEENN